MEGKNMRVVVQTIMLFLVVELVTGQPGAINTPQIPQPPTAANTPLIPQTPPADVLLPPTTPGNNQQLPPPTPAAGADVIPPLTPTLPVPGDNMPIIPAPGDTDGLGLIAPFIPGFGNLGLPSKKCLGQCNLGCRRSKSKRGGFTAKFCVGKCLLQCGIRISNEVFSCTNNCALSVSPNSISDAGEAQKVMDSCYEHCKNN